MIVILACTCAVAGFSVYLSGSVQTSRPADYFVAPAQYFSLLPRPLQACAADLFYIRGILALTDDYKDPREWLHFVRELFARALVLDPSLKESYFFAGVVAGNDTAALRQGIDFISRYRYLNPGDWRLPYWMGFNHYLLGEYVEAARYYQQASALPGAPSFLKSNQAMLFYQAGRPEMGVEYLKGLLYTAGDPRQKKWIELKLEWLKDIILLERKVGEFTALTGRPPRDLEELVEQGVIDELPEPSFAQRYYYDQEKGRVMSIFSEPAAGNAQQEKPCARCAE